MMNQTIAIDCPAEILVSLRMNAEGLTGFMKQQAAITPGWCNGFADWPGRHNG